MATPLTLAEDKFARLLGDYRSMAEIIPLPCPKLVEFVEDGILEGREVEDYLRERFALCGEAGNSAESTQAQAVRCDAVVLGCTHFPLLTSAIRRVIGADTALYDGGAGTARQAKNQLIEKGCKAAEGGRGTIRFMSSSPGREKYYEELFAMSMRV